MIRNGQVLDTAAMAFVGQRDVVIDDGVIVEVADGYRGDADVVVEAGDRFVVPGLIDAHVHFRLATMDFRRLERWTEVEYGIHMATLARQPRRRRGRRPGGPAVRVQHAHDRHRHRGRWRRGGAQGGPPQPA